MQIQKSKGLISIMRLNYYNSILIFICLLFVSCSNKQVPEPKFYFDDIYDVGDTLTYESRSSIHRIVITASYDTTWTARNISSQEVFQRVARYKLDTNYIYNYDFWGFGYDSVTNETVLLEEKIAGNNLLYCIFFEDFALQVYDTSIFNKHKVYLDPIKDYAHVLLPTVKNDPKVSSIFWNKAFGIYGFIYQSDTFLLKKNTGYK